MANIEIYTLLLTGFHLIARVLMALSLSRIFGRTIITQFSYSQFLDISTVLSNYFKPNILKIYKTNNKHKYSQHFSGKNPIIRDMVPRLEYDNKLNNFYNIEYILSDVKISENLIKEYKFEQFSLYLYKK